MTHREIAPRVNLNPDATSPRSLSCAPASRPGYSSRCARRSNLYGHCTEEAHSRFLAPVSMYPLIHILSSELTRNTTPVDQENTRNDQRTAASSTSSRCAVLFVEVKLVTNVSTSHRRSRRYAFPLPPLIFCSANHPSTQPATMKTAVSTRSSATVNSLTSSPSTRLPQCCWRAYAPRRGALVRAVDALPFLQSLLPICETFYPLSLCGVAELL